MQGRRSQNPEIIPFCSELKQLETASRRRGSPVTIMEQLPSASGNPASVSEEDTLQRRGLSEEERVELEQLREEMKLRIILRRLREERMRREEQERVREQPQQRPRGLFPQVQQNRAPVMRDYAIPSCTIMEKYNPRPRKASLTVRELLQRDYENSRGSFRDHIEVQEEYGFRDERITIQEDDDYYGSGGYDDHSTVDPHYQNYSSFSWENSNPILYGIDSDPQQQAPTQQPKQSVDEIMRSLAESAKASEAQREMDRQKEEAAIKSSEETARGLDRIQEKIQSIPNELQRMEVEQANIEDGKDVVVQEITTPIVDEEEQFIEEYCDIEEQPQRENTPEHDDMEIEASHNSDVGKFLEEEEVEANNEKIPTKINETILSLVEVVEQGTEREGSMCDPGSEKSLSNSFLVDVPDMINNWGSFDTFSSPLFHFDNQYYCIEFDNTYIYNTGFQVMEELEALERGFKSVKWKSMAIEKHGPDTFPFDNG